MRPEILKDKYLVIITVGDGDIHIPLSQWTGDNTDYTTSEILEIEEKTGYLARLNRPGYLDCTDWCGFDSRSEAIAHLISSYCADYPEGFCGFCNVETKSAFCQSCADCLNA